MRGVELAEHVSSGRPTVGGDDGRPVCTRPSKPQWRARTSLSSSSPTGHPRCHETPVIVARSDVGRAVTDPRKGGVAPGSDCECPARRSAESAAAPINTVRTSRGGRIRTDDLPLPKRALYQAELHPVWRTVYGPRRPVPPSHATRRR